MHVNLFLLLWAHCYVMASRFREECFRLLLCKRLWEIPVLGGIARWLLTNKLVISVIRALKFFIERSNFKWICKLLELFWSSLYPISTGVCSFVLSILSVNIRVFAITCNVEINNVFVHNHVFSSSSSQFLTRGLLYESLFYLNLLLNLVICVILSWLFLFGSHCRRLLFEILVIDLAWKLVLCLNFLLEFLFFSFSLLQHLHFFCELILLLSSGHKASLFIIDFSDSFFNMIYYELTCNSGHSCVHLVSILFLYLLLLKFLDFFL